MRVSEERTFTFPTHAPGTGRATLIPYTVTAGAGSTAEGASGRGWGDG